MTTAICRNTAPSTPTGRPLQGNSLFSLRSIGPWQFDAGSLGITLDIGTLFRQTCDVFLFQPEGLPDLSLSYSLVSGSMKGRRRYCDLIDGGESLLSLMTVQTFVPFAFLEAFLIHRDCFNNLTDMTLFHSTPSIFFVLDRTQQIQCVLVQSLGRGRWSIALRPSAATPSFDNFFVFAPLSLDR